MSTYGGASPPMIVTSPSGLQSPGLERRYHNMSGNSVIAGNALAPLPVDILDPDALISVDILIVHPNCPAMGSEGNNEQLQIVSIQFNSLDVIANQETIVELLSFAKRVAPSADRMSGHRRRRRMPTKDQACQTEESVGRYSSLTSLDSVQYSSFYGIQEPPQSAQPR